MLNKDELSFKYVIKKNHVLIDARLSSIKLTLTLLTGVSSKISSTSATVLLPK